MRKYLNISCKAICLVKIHRLKLQLGMNLKSTTWDRILLSNEQMTAYTTSVPTTNIHTQTQTVPQDKSTQKSTHPHTSTTEKVDCQC